MVNEIHGGVDELTEKRICGNVEELCLDRDVADNYPIESLRQVARTPLITLTVHAHHQPQILEIKKSESYIILSSFMKNTAKNF